jgi:hypothetical protein
MNDPTESRQREEKDMIQTIAKTSDSRIANAVCVMREISATSTTGQKAVLEAAIGVLQAHKKPTTRLDALKAFVLGRSKPKASTRAANDETSPLGWWRCIHANEWASTKFVVGRLYECRMDTTGGPRIYPDANSCWAPYWQPDASKFCYSKSEMDFEFVGRSPIGILLAA